MIPAEGLAGQTSPAGGGTTSQRRALAHEQWGCRRFATERHAPGDASSTRSARVAFSARCGRVWSGQPTMLTQGDRFSGR